MRDRLAAYMIRAAATGAFNYTGADPYNKNWRLRHTLVLRELMRVTNEQMLRDAHQHWLAFVSHAQLEPDSWKMVKQKAADALTDLSKTLYSETADQQNETKSPADTIYEKYGDLIASYRALVANENAAQKTNNG